MKFLISAFAVFFMFSHVFLVKELVAEPQAEPISELGLKLFQQVDSQYGFNKNPEKESVKLVGSYEQVEDGISKMVLVMVHDPSVQDNGINYYKYLNFALLTKDKDKWNLKGMYLDSIPCESFKRECKFKIVKMTSGKKVVMSESQIEYLGGMEGFLNIVGLIGNKFKRMLKVKVFDRDKNGDHSGVSNLGELQFNTFTSKYKFVKNAENEFDDLKILTVGKKPVVGDNISENSKFAHERARNFRTLRFYTIIHGRYEIVQNKTRYSKPTRIAEQDYENSLNDKLFKLNIEQDGSLYIIQGDSNRIELEKKPFSISLTTEFKEDIKVYVNKSEVDVKTGRGFKFLTYFLNDYVSLDTLTAFEPRNRIKMDSEENNFLIASTEGHARWSLDPEKKSDFTLVENKDKYIVATKKIEKIHFAKKSGSPIKTELLTEVTENMQKDTIYEIIFLAHVPGKGKQFKCINVVFK